MGSIQKRKRQKRDGTSYHVWRAATRVRGRQVSSTFARKVDAQDWLTTTKGRKLNGTAVDPAGGRILYGDWLERWWATRRHAARPSTLARDESYLRNHVEPRWGEWQLAAIERSDVVEWVGALSDGGLAPATVRKLYQLFSATMEAAVTERHLGVSPCRSVDLPAVKREPMRFLTGAEVERLADAIDPRYRALVLVLAYGGLRIGEAAALTTERVDLGRRQLHVVQTVSWVKGHLYLHEPKTAAGRRKVGLPASVAEELADHLATVEGELAFPAPGGGHLQPNHFRRRQFAPAVRETGLEGLRIHDLRHTAVSFWHMRGVASDATAGGCATPMDGHVARFWLLRRSCCRSTPHDEVPGQELVPPRVMQQTLHRGGQIRVTGCIIDART